MLPCEDYGRAHDAPDRNTTDILLLRCITVTAIQIEVRDGLVKIKGKLRPRTGRQSPEGK